MNQILQILATGIGIAIGSTLGLMFADKVSSRNDYENVRKRWRKKLSPDREPKEFCCGYLLYNNGATWWLDDFCRIKLMWLPSSMTNGEEEKMRELIYGQQSDIFIEYQSCWLPRKRAYRNIQWIMKNHPNLRKL